MARKPLVVLAFLCIAGLSGCGGASSSVDPLEVPIATMNDAGATAARRGAAVEHASILLESNPSNAADIRETLKWAVWKRHTTQSSVRVLAAKALVADAPRRDDTENMFRLLLPTETDWAVIGVASDAAAEHGWESTTASFVRTWSKDRPDDQVRPENPSRRALERMYPGEPAEATVYRVFAGELGGEELKLEERTSAWALLGHLDPNGTYTKDLLSEDSDPSRDALVRMMQRAARELSIVASTAEEAAWLERLGDSKNAANWEKATEVVATLSPDQKKGLALRHLPGLVWSSEHNPSLLTMDRSQMLAQLETMLDGVRQYQRQLSENALGGGWERLDQWADEMVWGDLLLVHIGFGAARFDGIRGESFLIADKDMADTSTEYGGVIDWTDTQEFRMTMFPPRPTQRFGDNRFVASIDLIEQSDFALFHFHMQVQQFNNRQFAGPSAPDIDYADEFGRACLVYTFIDKSTLNVDYYQPGGARVDLGVIKRLGSR